jgi:thymidylate synthase
MTISGVRDLAISTETIGEAWLEVARRILSDGTPSEYDGLPILEVAQATLTVQTPRAADPLIERLADPERLAWMHANFTDHSLVRELGDARSYASRLFDYAGVGRDQVQWVIDRLRADPTSRSATITTFEPLLDTSYIPCVSLLDFWIRDGAVEQLVYAHSIDFGSKGYGNLVELAWLQQHVAEELGLPVGRLVFIVKSAHVYEREFGYMTDVLSQVDGSR